MTSGPGAEATPASPDESVEDVGSVTLPEAAQRRLHAAAWTSNLSVADFANCEELGMEPLGFVQGYSVMQWAWYASYGWAGYGPGGTPGQYAEQWRCPHGFVSGEHRAYGVNMEQSWVEQAWRTGWELALERMLDEARELGAHGVVGIRDTMRPLAGSSTEEFSIHGTAVTVKNAPRPDQPFSTYLAGQRLAKLLEAGFAPVSVVGSLASVYLYANCVTLYQLNGSASMGAVGGVRSIEQVGRAQQAARGLARRELRRQLGNDVLHGAQLSVFERESGEGAMAIQCLIKGTRVRPFKRFDPLPPPSPVVRLS